MWTRPRQQESQSDVSSQCPFFPVVLQSHFAKSCEPPFLTALESRHAARLALGAFQRKCQPLVRTDPLFLLFEWRCAENPQLAGNVCSSPAEQSESKRLRSIFLSFPSTFDNALSRWSRSRQKANLSSKLCRCLRATSSTEISSRRYFIFISRDTDKSVHSLRHFSRADRMLRSISPSPSISSTSFIDHVGRRRDMSSTADLTLTVGDDVVFADDRHKSPRKMEKQRFFTCRYTQAFSFQQVQLSSLTSSSPSFRDDVNHGHISLSISTSRANDCTGMLTARIRFIRLINTIIRNKRTGQSNGQPDPHYLRHVTGGHPATRDTRSICFLLHRSILSSE